MRPCRRRRIRSPHSGPARRHRIGGGRTGTDRMPRNRGSCSGVTRWAPSTAAKARSSAFPTPTTRWTTASWAVKSRRCCFAPGGPGTQSAVFPNVQASPVVRGEAKRGRRPGPAFAGRAPCCRSRSGNWNTRRVRCTARTWRTRADGIGTGTSERAFRRRRRSGGPRRRPCPRFRPCASAAARPVFFKSSCPAFSLTASRSAQSSQLSRGRSKPEAGATSSRNNCRTSPPLGQFGPGARSERY